MAQGNNLANALGSHDAADFGAGEYVALGQGHLEQKLEGCGAQFHHRFGNGHALCGLLASNVHHGHIALPIQMRKTAVHKHLVGIVVTCMGDCGRPAG